MTAVFQKNGLSMEMIQKPELSVLYQGRAFGSMIKVVVIGAQF
jgi:hypothetical protein